MSEGTAIIIAAVIGGAIAVVGIVLPQLFNYLQRKADFKERLFFDAYQKRLAVYEDVIKVLADMGKPEADLKKISKQEFSDKVMVDFHTLVILSNRLRIYGSPEARSIMVESVSRMTEICKELQKEFHFSVGIEIISNAVNKEPLVYVIDSFIILVNESLTGFTKLVRMEAGTDFTDKRLGEIQKEFAKDKTAKKPAGDCDGQKNKHNRKGFLGKDKTY
jgi:hypothetical protein